MRGIGLIFRSDVMLDKEHHNIILKEIETVNLKRLKILLPILFIIQLLFIVFNDIIKFINPTASVIWKDTGYFIVHMLLISLSIIGFIIVNRLMKLELGKWKRIYCYFTPNIIMVYLAFISFISVLDQLYIKNISNLFIANLLICGGVFVIKFPQSLYTYAIPFLLCSISYFYMSFERNIIFSNSINNLIFLFAVIIISSSRYNYQYELIAKNILLKKTNKQLNYISNHDALTGLLNRRYFMELMESELDEKSEPMSVVLADIDFFKNVNDQYGHPIGDIVLKEVSSVITKCIKEGDLAVRWGGEEFLLLLNNTTMEEAYVFTDFLRHNIAELSIPVKEDQIHVSASFGIAFLKEKDEKSFQRAYKDADIALYQAKNQGRNRVDKKT